VEEEEMREIGKMGKNLLLLLPHLPQLLVPVFSVPYHLSPL
jgi:hypothetical protein